MSIFAQNLWLGGNDANGNPLVSAESYSTINNSAGLPQGPLSAEGLPVSSNCADYQRVWDVRRHDVDVHLADFADNGQIDNPVTAILGWPGRGNAEFFSIYGFELPEDEDLAPFMDLDEDGIYEPLDGEYPVEPFGHSIAGHMTWEVYHTLNPSFLDDGDPPLIAQIHHTQWSFYCTDNEYFNTAVFSRYEMINKGPSDISGFRAGIWTDFDLGCFTDDYIGSSPERNVFFSYNQDNEDNLICEQGVPAFGDNPPTQSVAFLNKDMVAFSTLFNSVVADPPAELTDPGTSEAIFNRLNGLLNDGTSITNVGLGTDETMGEETFFHWPGNPNNLDDWSMLSTNVGPADIRGLGVVDFGEWPIGERVVLDLAFGLHRAEGNNFLDNVELLYQEVDQVQALYDEGFEFLCSPIVCTDDCVWPGDLNNDGIANYVDLVALGFGFNESGPLREQPIFWAPTPGDTWEGQQVFEDAPDLKHLDGNDDGLVDENDFLQTLEFYNLTRPDYQEEEFNTPGNEIQITRTNGTPIGPIPAGTFRPG
ncbi:MAG: hypothetical protein AAFR97_12480, partial [Bacteroidota bacterium]